jgi:hypothetical protein
MPSEEDVIVKFGAILEEMNVIERKNDLVLAAAGGYDWSKIEVWALSLVTSGFEGKKAVIIYDSLLAASIRDTGGLPQVDNDLPPATKNNLDVIKRLNALGFMLFVKPMPQSIFNARFYDFHEIINHIDGLSDDENPHSLRFAIVTDIRDVAFQSNPSLALERWLDDGEGEYQLYAAAEGLSYRDEPWGCDNVKAGYPSLADRVMDKEIYNVGVLLGSAQTVADMCLSVGMIAKSSGYGVADQSGYNILLDMAAWSSITRFGRHDDGVVCQAGTTADPNKIDAFRPNLLCPEPVLRDGEVFASAEDDELYPIVHQYDRVPEWDRAMRAKINEKLRAQAGAA